jgi:hypothetical protein
MDDEKRRGPGEGEAAGWASGMGTMGEYLTIGVVFPVALVGGFFLGRWIGGFFGGPTAGALTGLLLGTAAAFYNLWETLQRIQRREAEDARKDAERAEERDR